MFVDVSGAPNEAGDNTQKNTINFASDTSIDCKGHLQMQAIGTTMAGKGGTNAEVIAPKGNTKIDCQGYEVNAAEIKLSAGNQSPILHLPNIISSTRLMALFLRARLVSSALLVVLLIMF